MNTKDDLLKKVSADGHAIRHISQQDEGLCLAAVRQNPLSIRYIRKPSGDVALVAVKGNPKALDILRERGLDECLKVVRVLEYGMNLKFCRKTSLICREAVHRTPEALSFVPKFLQDEEMVRDAVFRNPLMLFAAKPSLVTYSLCLEVVRKDPYAVKYVPGRHRKHDIAEIVCGVPELRKYIDPVHRRSM